MPEYIEREALIKEISYISVTITGGRLVGRNLLADAFKFYAEKILKEIIKAPTADVVEVKHGEWVKHKPDPDKLRQFHAFGIAKSMSENSIFWTCSCCGCWGTPAYKYCSQCGAKMDLKEGANNG